MPIKSVVYIGGGYVGLTGAIHFAKASIDTTIFDLDQKVVDDINKGTPKGDDFLRYLTEDVGSLVEMKYLKATSNWDDVRHESVFIIAVPSEKDGEPYDEIVLSVVKKILLESRTDERPTIIIESTLSPGVGNKIISYASALDLKVGEDFYLAVCPRKDWFADPEKNLATLPRVIGGVTNTCSLRACVVLSNVSHDLHVTSHDTAELTKALENAFLHVPTMLAHELAIARPDLDVAEAVRLASLHWRLPNYYIGFGPGGRCVPLGTKYLTEATKGCIDPLTIGLQATQQDNEIRRTIAAIAEQEWKRRGEKGVVLVMGLGYRPDFKDVGLSPGLAIANILQSRNIPVLVHDPLFTTEEVQEQFNLVMADFDNFDWSNVKVMLLATAHTQYLSFPHTNIWREGQYILDAQGTWSDYKENFELEGVEYHQVGDRGWYDPSLSY